MKACQKIKKTFGTGEGTDAYTVWLTKMNRCLDKAMSRHSAPAEDGTEPAHSSAQ